MPAVIIIMSIMKAIAAIITRAGTSSVTKIATAVAGKANADMTKGRVDTVTAMRIDK